MKMCLPLQQISPSFSFGFSFTILMSVPGMLVPASLKLARVLPWNSCLLVMFWGPEASLMPYTLQRQKFRLRKYCLISGSSDAAPQQKKLHSSSPNCCLILLKMSFFAILNYRLVYWPVSSWIVPSGPTLFAHPAILVFSHPFQLATCFIFSDIFYHTLGTDRKAVGLTSCRVWTSDPCRASGWAKQTCSPLIMAVIRSAYIPAACESGRQETIRPGGSSLCKQISTDFFDQTRLSWDSMTPLGMPVVPLVQTSVAQLPGLTLPILSSTDFLSTRSPSLMKSAQCTIRPLKWLRSALASLQMIISLMELELSRLRYLLAQSMFSATTTLHSEFQAMKWHTSWLFVVQMPVAMDRANRLPAKATSHSGELNPMMFTDVNSGNPQAIRLAANPMHCLKYSGYPMVCHLPCFFTDRAGRSEYFVAASRNQSMKVVGSMDPMPVSCSMMGSQTVKSSVHMMPFMGYLLSLAVESKARIPSLEIRQSQDLRGIFPFCITKFNNIWIQSQSRVVVEIQVGPTYDGLHPVCLNTWDLPPCEGVEIIEGGHSVGGLWQPIEGLLAGLEAGGIEDEPPHELVGQHSRLYARLLDLVQDVQQILAIGGRVDGVLLVVPRAVGIGVVVRGYPDAVVDLIGHFLYEVLDLQGGVSAAAGVQPDGHIDARVLDVHDVLDGVGLDPRAGGEGQDGGIHVATFHDALEHCGLVVGAQLGGDPQGAGSRVGNGQQGYCFVYEHTNQYTTIDMDHRMKNPHRHQQRQSLSFYLIRDGVQFGFRLDGHFLPLGRDGVVGEEDALVPDVEAPEAEHHRLQHPARPRQEVRVRPALCLREHPEWLLQEGHERSLEVLVGHARVFQLAVQQGEDGEGHGRSAPVRHPHLVVLQVPQDVIGLGDDVEGERQQVGIGLLYVLSVVPGVLLCHPIGHLQYYYLLADLLPSRVRCQAQDLRGLVGDLQGHLGHPIGEGVVVDVLGPLVSPHHIVDVVEPILPVLDPALEELSHLLDDGVALLSQPLLVLSDRVVVPCPEGHAATNVMLQWSREGPDRSLLVA